MNPLFLSTSSIFKVPLCVIIHNVRNIKVNDELINDNCVVSLDPLGTCISTLSMFYDNNTILKIHL